MIALTVFCSRDLDCEFINVPSGRGLKRACPHLKENRSHVMCIWPIFTLSICIHINTIYIYMHICKYRCIFVYRYMCIYMCAYIYVYLYMYIHIYIYMYMCVCVCLGVCVRVCVHICIHAYICVHES